MGNSHTTVANTQEDTLGCSISFILPALNEEAGIGHAIDSIVQEGLPDSDEIIVVDGGSRDRTAAVAKKHGAKVTTSSKGRGLQMNEGARLAGGQYLLFLHADSQLPPRYRQLMGETFRAAGGKEQPAWGCFQSIELDKKGLWACITRASVALRTRFMHLPYGDQAIFVRHETFRRLGGYIESPLMEDVDMVRKLRRSYGPPAIVPQVVLVSARRWERLGHTRTTLLNWWIMAAYTCGCPPKTLARWYYGG